jgi:hypothetical protein
MADEVYSVDTSLLMDWQAPYYPTDVFASLVKNMDALVASGRMFAAELVREEAEVVGTAGLIQWVQTKSGMFVSTANLLTDSLAVQNQFTGLRDPKAEYEEADPYVIALAQQTGGIVVTQETPASEKNRPRRTHFIPDVCRELGIPCISLLGMMRREKWVL